ncbi:MAG TPA: hypothetical protein VGK30_00170 [Candidatus Binatia bacterium]
MAIVTNETHAQLTAVAALYGELETHVATGDWRQVGAVLHRLDALLPALAGIGAARRVSDAGDGDETRAIDALMRAVVEAHARALQRADAARRTAASALASAHQGHSQAARYRPAAGREAFFQSRTV